MTTDLRPPTPDLQGRELVQWFQRVYDAIQELNAAIGVLPDVPTSHNELSDNGGTNSHTTISAHIVNTNAHGVSEIVGAGNTQTLKNKIISALENTLTGLRHGIEVDNLSSGIHGVTGSIVGTTDIQTLTNKRIVRKVVDVADSHTVDFTDDIIRCTQYGVVITINTNLATRGKPITIDNVSFGDVYVVGDQLATIENEVNQVIPPDSSMTLYFDGATWRII
jgi:hypothetical protein